MIVIIQESPQIRFTLVVLLFGVLGDGVSYRMLHVCGAPYPEHVVLDKETRNVIWGAVNICTFSR